MTGQMKLPLLLAPCGSPEALAAAVAGGADEVYLGGRVLNARMNAKNFDDGEMERAVAFAHEHGVRVHVTLNTLVLDREMPEVLRYVEFLYRTGVDALIVADLGLAARIREYFPDFEMHASTQAGGHNREAAEFFAARGFSRMVAARELSLSNIRELCAASPIPIEIFLHGAHCVSCSGQCLLSQVMGGRSGNRGQCAQPCRLPYNNGYPLSMKDMCLASHITEILKTGVVSLKIEGRMKPPEYVFGVSRIYRRLLDEGRNATAEEMGLLAGLFSRSGFTDGYFTGRIGKGMLGIRTEEDKKASAAVEMKAEESARCLPPLPEYTGRSSSLPSDEELKKALRPPKGGKPLSPEKMKKSACFFDPSAVTGTDYFDEIYVALEHFPAKGANGVWLPPVIMENERDKVKRMMERAYQAGAKHCLVGNPGHLALAREFDWEIHGDFRLNLFNSSAAGVYLELRSLVLSPELTLPQIRDIGGPKRVIAYGRLPVMLLEKPVGTAALRDRKGASFPVLREGKRDILVNSVPIYMGDRLKKLAETGMRGIHFIFTTEKKNECEKVIRDFREGRVWEGAFKRIQG